MATSLPPLWQACPDIPRYSIGWRMGGGEDYWHKWHEWFVSLSAAEREAYVHAQPEPADWVGFYDHAASYKAEPTQAEPGDAWKMSAQPIGADEISITNSLRIGWLMMNGLNKIDPGPGDPPDSPTSRLLRWVDGSKWQYICDSDYRNNRLVKVFQ